MEEINHEKTLYKLDSKSGYPKMHMKNAPVVQHDKGLTTITHMQIHGKPFPFSSTRKTAYIIYLIPTQVHNFWWSAFIYTKEPASQIITHTHTKTEREKEN